MSIAHVIQYIGKNFGGPVVSMAALTTGLSILNVEVEVYSTHRQSEGEVVPLAPNVKTSICRDVALGSFRYSRSLWTALDATDCSLIHSHGLWGDPNRCAAAIARRKGIPHLLGPCGMLEPNALQRSYWKKFLVKVLFQDKALREAACLLAKSEKECQDIRTYGLTNPVALIPNPVFGPETVLNPVSPEEVRRKFPFREGKRNLLYLGRIHPVKGIRRLAEAWCRSSEFHDSWNLIIAGPDEGGFQSNIEDIIRKGGCADSVTFTGSLDDRWKWGVLRESDLFVMPSDYENFGIAIVEALLAGVPVIATTRTPWRVLQEKNAGWMVEPETDALVDVLTEALAKDGHTLQEMGGRGQVIGKGFAPDAIAAQLVAVYDWLLGRGRRPGCVKD